MRNLRMDVWIFADTEWRELMQRGSKIVQVYRVYNFFFNILCNQNNLWRHGLQIKSNPEQSIYIGSILTPRATSSLNKGSKFFLDQGEITWYDQHQHWRQPLQQLRHTCRLVIIAIQIAYFSNLLNTLYFYIRAQCSPVLLLLYK